MTLKYQLTLDDVVAFALYHHTHSSTTRRFLAKAIFVMWVLVLGTTAFADAGQNQLFLYGATVIYLIVSTVLVIVIMRRLAVSRARGHYKDGVSRGLLGLHELEIDESGLTERSEFRENRRAWRAIDNIVQNKDYVFIYDSPLTAFVVPKRDITNEDLDGFVALTQRFESNNNPQR